MQEFAINLSFSQNPYHDHELHQGMAPPGLTDLTYRWRAKREGRNETQAKQAFMHACVCSNQCYKKGRLVCTSSCHGCPALHRRTGPLAPHDNHSLAEGHRFCPNLTSNHLQSFSSSPLSFVSAATRLVHGDTRRAMCMLHTRRAHLRFIPDSLTSFR